MDDRAGVKKKRCYKSKYQPDFKNVTFNMCSTNTVVDTTRCVTCKLCGGTCVLPSMVWNSTDKMITPDPVNVVVIAEAPGMTEDRDGFPLVGVSGELLLTTFESLLGSNGVPPMLLTNAVWCRPPGNKTPEVTLIRQCNHNLSGVLADTTLVADDAVLFAAGATSLKALWRLREASYGNSTLPDTFTSLQSMGIPSTLKLATYEGKEVVRSFTIYPIYHPSFILRQVGAGSRSGVANEHVLKLLESYAKSIRTGLQIAGRIKKLEPKLTFDKVVTRVFTEHLLPKDYEEIFAELDTAEKVTLDVETRNLELFDVSNSLLMVGMAYDENKAFQFSKSALSAVGPILRHLRDKKKLLVNHNIAFDIKALYRFGIIHSVEDLPKRLNDTIILAHLIDENKDRSLKLKMLLSKIFQIPDYSEELTDYFKEMVASKTGKSKDLVQLKKEDKDFSLIPVSVLSPYNVKDIIGTYHLHTELKKKLELSKHSGDWRVDYIGFLSKVDRELIQMVLTGLPYDIEKALALYSEMQTEQAQILTKLNSDMSMRKAVALLRVLSKEQKELVTKRMGYIDMYHQTIPTARDQFNPNSTDHVITWLVHTLPETVKTKLRKHIGKEGKTATGRLAMGKEALASIHTFIEKAAKKYSGIGESIELLAKYKKNAKIMGTYIEGLIRQIWPDGRVRGAFLVYGTVTGRLSSRDPNLQNLPSRDMRIKDLIYAVPGTTLIEFDLSQAEIRGAASLARDPLLKQAFVDKLDIHRYIASMSLNVLYDKVTDEQRQVSKAISFSILYGSSAHGMALKLGCTDAYAESVIQSFYTRFPRMKAWIKQQHEWIDTHDYVLGAMGRKRRLPRHLYPNDGERHRLAVNNPVQNLASDFNLMQLVLIMEMVREKRLEDRAFSCEALATVHDSILFMVSTPHLKHLYKLYEEANSKANSIMESWYGKDWVDMAFDAKVGATWGTMQKYHPE